MIRVIETVLSAEAVEACRQTLAQARWLDGRITAGDQSAGAKRNLQAAEDCPQAGAARQQVRAALARSPRFMSAALPLKIYPPLFNRYAQGMGFGDHVDNAIRTSPVTGESVRTDLSATLFLSAPGDYDGGELAIGDGDWVPKVKLGAGDMVLYPSTSVHRVTPVTRGERWACVFWVQSLVADAAERDLLSDLDAAIAQARPQLGDDHPSAVALVGAYHNLVRKWART